MDGFHIWFMIISWITLVPFSYFFKLSVTRLIMKWNPEFDRFFDAHEKIKKMGGRLTIYNLD